MYYRWSYSMLKYIFRCLTDLHFAWILIISLKQLADVKTIYFLVKLIVTDYGVFFFGPPEICFIKLLSLLNLIEFNVWIFFSNYLL